MSHVRPKTMQFAQKRDHHLLKVLTAPIVSEKATMISEKNNQVLFDVQPNASKQDIKNAVEFLFGVSVLSVNVLNRAGKQKRFGKLQGCRKQKRRAYVCLHPDNEINFDGNVDSSVINQNGIVN